MRGGFWLIHNDEKTARCYMHDNNLLKSVDFIFSKPFHDFDTMTNPFYLYYYYGGRI